MYDFSELDRPEYKNVSLTKFIYGENTLPISVLLAPNYRTFPCRHAFIQILWSKRGVYDIKSGSDSVRLETGDGIVLPPYVPHEVSPARDIVDNGSMFELEFPTEFLPDETIYSLLKDTVFGFSHITGSLRVLRPPTAIRRRAEEILGAMTSAYTERFLYDDTLLLLRAMTVELLVLLHRSYGNVSGKADISALHRKEIQKALDYIANHYAENFKVEELYRISAMSPTNFRKVFRIVTGYNPVGYIARLRVDSAIKLLRDNPGLTMTDAALACGFGSASNFDRVIKKTLGYPPGEIIRRS